MIRMLSLFVALFSSAVAFGEDAVNLLKPVNKLETWQLEQHSGAEATLKIADDAAVVDAVKLGTQNWHVQLFQSDLDLKEGKDYTLTVKLASSKRRSLLIVATIAQEDWHEIGLHEDLSIDTKERSYDFTFRATGVAAKKNRIGFVLGDEKGDVIIKEMKLTEKPAKK